MASSRTNGSKTAATIVFSLGSILLMGNLMAAVVTDGELSLGDNILGTGLESGMGWLGIFLWIIGIGMIVFARLSDRKTRSFRARPVFLKGRKGIKCHSCGSFVKGPTDEYHERVACSECGAEYDMFQEGPWDEEDHKKEGSAIRRIPPRNGASPASRTRKGKARPRKVPSRPPRR